MVVNLQHLIADCTKEIKIMIKIRSNHQKSETLPSPRRQGAGLAHALGFDDAFHAAQVFGDGGADDEILENSCHCAISCARHAQTLLQVGLGVGRSFAQPRLQFGRARRGQKNRDQRAPQSRVLAGGGADREAAPCTSTLSRTSPPWRRRSSTSDLGVP